MAKFNPKDINQDAQACQDRIPSVDGADLFPTMTFGVGLIASSTPVDRRAAQQQADNTMSVVDV